jgi:hypothetical protein
LIVDPDAPDQVVRETLRVRVKLGTAPVVRRVFARVDDGAGIALPPDPNDPSLRQASEDIRTSSDGRQALAVEAQDAAGRAGRDTIAIRVARSGRCTPPPRIGDGGDRDSVGAWPEKGVSGAHLGPNRNGRKL